MSRDMRRSIGLAVQLAAERVAEKVAEQGAYADAMNEIADLAEEADQVCVELAGQTLFDRLKWPGVAEADAATLRAAIERMVPLMRPNRRPW